MDGVSLAARFSWPTNSRNFCGPGEAAPALYRAAVGQGDLAEARGALLQFEALTPYLRAIAARSGLDPLDAEVVEAYWIGNRLLDAFPADGFGAILEALVAGGLPATMAGALAARVPPGAIPHHAFHVLFVGVGSVTGHVETTLGNMDLCRISSGVVEEVVPRRLRLARAPLEVVDAELRLGRPVAAEVEFDPAWLPGVAPGAVVAMHWGVPVLALDPARADALARYSARSLAAANAAIRRARGASPAPGGAPARASGVRSGR